MQPWLFSTIAGSKCSHSGVSALLRCHLELCFWFKSKGRQKRENQEGMRNASFCIPRAKAGSELPWLCMELPSLVPGPPGVMASSLRVQKD